LSDGVRRDEYRLATEPGKMEGAKVVEVRKGAELSQELDAGCTLTGGWVVQYLFAAPLCISRDPKPTETMAAKLIDRQFHNVPGAYRSLDIL